MTTAILSAKDIHKTLRFAQALLHESFTSKWWLSFKIETWNFIKKTFTIFQFNENGLCIFRLKSEHIIQKSASKMHLSWMMLRKQGALNNKMLSLGCCFPPYRNSWLRACYLLSKTFMICYCL